MKKRNTTTMADIARETGVSIPTVSYILNGRAKERHLSEKTTKAVLAKAEELGYVRNALASSLRQKRTNTVGIIVSDLERGWANRLLKGMLSSFDQAGLSTVITVHFWDPQRERKELQTFIEEKKAAIITRPHPENVDIYRQINDRGIPLILLDQPKGCEEFSYVMWDARKAVRLSVEHLMERGRKKIGYFGVDRGTEEEHQRYRSFRYCLRHHGLTVKSSWIYLDKRYVLEEVPGEAKVVGYGSKLRDAFMSGGDHPDAILASTDALACTCISILRDELGYKIPEDIAVMGLGDVGESGIMGLSTCSEPIDDIGKLVGQITTDLIGGKVTGPVHELVDYALLQARSTT